MGTVRVNTVVRFSYVIDDTGFSGSEIAERQLDDPIGSSIDAYLESEPNDEFTVIEQAVTVEQETHLTNDDVLWLGDVMLLSCGHGEYSQSRCAVQDCTNYIGLLTERTYTRGESPNVVAE